MPPLIALFVNPHFYVAKAVLGLLVMSCGGRGLLSNAVSDKKSDNGGKAECCTRIGQDVGAISPLYLCRTNNVLSA